MTHHPEHDPRDQAVKLWLEQHQHAVTNALDDALDVEAGLHEILLHSRHNSAVDDLDTILNTEAGLADILPATTERPPATTRDANDTAHGHAGTDEFPVSASPADRMALRNHPDVKAASDALTSALVIGFRLDQEHGVYLDLGYARAHVASLGRDLIRNLIRDIQDARAFSSGLAPGSEYDRALSVGLDLARSLDRVFSPTHDPDDALNRALDIVLAISHALALNRTLALQRALDRAEDLNRILSVGRALNHAHHHDIARGLDDALNCAYALNPNPAPDIVLNPAHSRILAKAVIDVRTDEVRRAIGLALLQDPPPLDTDSVRAFLDDFTTADLRTTNLADVDLDGVRWSQHTTRWPKTMDVELLKTHSEETPPGSGNWTVQSGTATIHDFADRG
ncbi:hypothetical protein ACIPSA_46710 [Streptomyces sp. NPDC086549]|uniref:hypothetical protein n=1 Tax=Streptomyces sp. NPDC086549 TaxID=3365752 RepID=UPI00381ED221